MVQGKGGQDQLRPTPRRPWFGAARRGDDPRQRLGLGGELRGRLLLPGVQQFAHSAEQKRRGGAFIAPGQQRHMVEPITVGRQGLFEQY
jgi:hypothetical protein